MKKIAIIGGPGAGKTTLSAGLFYELKIKRKNVELVPELIKFKVYKNEDFSKPGFDILNTLEQKNLEEGFSGHPLDFLLCEAPLCNGYFYASFYKKNLEVPVLKEIAKDALNSYDLLLFVRREDEEYFSLGRKETLNQALALESHILELLKEFNLKTPLHIVSAKTLLSDVVQIVLNT